MRLTDGIPLDPAIRPLCDALRAAGCATIYSCGAHLDADPPHRRAYVTFATGDVAWVASLRDWLAAAPPPAHVDRDLRFDCLLGRYTVSLAAPAGGADRAPLDRALRGMTAWLRRQPPTAAASTTCPVPEGRVPAVVPCRTVLGRAPACCGWTGTPLPAAF